MEFEPRNELTPMPPRIAALPIDARGYPVPWFVAWVDGVPEFRMADGEKWRRAIEEARCWVCGGVLGKYLTFAIGPMCSVNRVTSEPACHRNCAEWSVQNCPFLLRPHMVRRQDEEINNERLVAESAGTALARNPGVTALWTTQTYHLFDAGNRKPLIALGPPVHVAWWREGRHATRREVQESIAGGLPALQQLAEEQDALDVGAGAVKELSRMLVVATQFFPAGA